MLPIMKVLTVIVSYNFERWLDACIGSVLRSDCPSDIVVIDNASGDRTVERLRRDYPGVRVVANRENLGFGRANNIGLRMALEEGYQAVFLLNQDAWIAPDVLGRLARAAEGHRDYGVLSPVHFNGKGDALDRGFAGYVGAASPGDLPAGREVAEAGFVNAAFWFIPVGTLRRVGGFSPLFYHYGEDKDYVNRLHYHGLKVGYLPGARACHDREFRPVSRDAFFRSEYVYLLSEYANVNYPFVRAFAYGVLACVKKALSALRHGRWSDGGRYASLCLRLLSASVRVCRTRRLTRRPGDWFIG